MTDRDPFDAPLRDSDLQEEVELTAHLIVAANDSDRALSQREVDQILGVAGSVDSQ
jgi:hypothetical protein